MLDLNNKKELFEGIMNIQYTDNQLYIEQHIDYE